jgi:2-oxo-4-hydroxy-4-carboxy--5-ureidoimidazoline (OHCU) decarboxylase
MECAISQRFSSGSPICAGRHDQTSISAEFERRLAGEPVVEYRTAWTEIAAIMALKLPRFRRVVLDLGDYGSLVTASIAAS